MEEYVLPAIAVVILVWAFSRFLWPGRPDRRHANNASWVDDGVGPSQRTSGGNRKQSDSHNKGDVDGGGGGD